MTRIKALTALAGLVTAGMALIPASASAQITPMPFGLYQSSNNPPYSFPVTPNYAVKYYGWYVGFQAAEAQAAWNDGTETFAELQTCDNPCDSTGIPIAEVTSGSFDAYLTSFAESVKAFGHPVLLTFDHEMNGSWYPWGDTEVTPAQWIAAWQHVTSLISAIAPNAVWVWAPNIEAGAAPVASYWPGNGYLDPHVNMVGLDGYFINSTGTWANSFARSVADVKSVSGNTYPFMVAETGVPATDPNSLAQIDDLISGARSAGAWAVIYFDSGSEWAFTSAEQSEFIKDVG